MAVECRGSITGKQCMPWLSNSTTRLPTLLGVGQPALEGDISLQPSAIPHLDSLVIAGAHKEQAVLCQRQLVDPLAVLRKVSHEDPLGVPGGAGGSPQAHSGRL